MAEDRSQVRGRTSGILVMCLVLLLTAFSPIEDKASEDDAFHDETEFDEPLGDHEMDTLPLGQTSDTVESLARRNAATSRETRESETLADPDDLIDVNPNDSVTDDGGVIRYADVEKIHKQRTHVPAHAPEHAQVAGEKGRHKGSSPDGGIPREIEMAAHKEWILLLSYQAMLWYTVATSIVDNLAPLPPTPCVPDPGTSHCAGGTGDDTSASNTGWAPVNRYPFSTVARITYRDYDGDPWSCSGFLIDSDKIVTNGHCLLGAGEADPDVGRGWYPRRSYTIEVAYDHQAGSSAHRCGAAKRVTVQGWSRPGPWDPADYDYGVIELDCQTSVGWMGYWWSTRDEHQFARDWGLISGHPGGARQVWSEGNRTGHTSSRLFNNNPAADGMSGGPRWNERRGACGSCAHSIHRDIGDSVLINEEVFDNLFRWKDQGW